VLKAFDQQTNKQRPDESETLYQRDTGQMIRTFSIILMKLTDCKGPDGSEATLLFDKSMMSFSV